MKWIIIDSVVNRAQMLQQKLNSELQTNANHIRLLDESSMPEDDTIYLIHNSDGYVDDFANRSKTLKDTFAIFYSGGGLSLSSLKSRGATIGFFSGVLHHGNEHEFVLLMLKVKDVLSNDEPNKKGKFEKLFGHDPILESKLNFLQHCLTPDGLKEEEVTKSEWAKLNEFIKLQAANDGPFGDNYLEALRTLRDKLLAS